MTRRIEITSVLLSFGLLTACLLALHVRHEQLLTELTDLRNRQRSSIRSHAANDRASLNRPTAEAAAKPQVTADMVEQARLEVAQLERRAVSRRAEMLAESARRKAADAAALANDNRDPVKGMAKLEYFQNVGTDTPGAALQTMVWAALTGDDAVLARGLALDDRARARAVELLAGLPESARQQSTPEKLAALWFAVTVMDVPAINISGQVAEDSTHVTLLVRGGIGNEQKLPMQLGPTGWQIVVPERAIEDIQQKVTGASPPLPPRS